MRKYCYLQSDHLVVQSDVNGLESSQLLVLQCLDGAGELGQQQSQHVHRPCEVDGLLLHNRAHVHVCVFCESSYLSLRNIWAWMVLGKGIVLSLDKRRIPLKNITQDLNKV